VARLREGRGPLIALIGAILVETVAIWLVHWIHTRGYLDTEVYRLGARAWLRGYPLYGDTLTPDVPGSVTLPFIYPPFAALLFVPLAWMPVGAAIVTVAALSHVSILLTCFVLARSSHYLAPRTALVPAVTVLLMPFVTLIEPARETLNYGQINLVLMALVTADCLLPRTRWPRGQLVGIAAAIKLTPLVFLLLFVLRRDFRAAATTLATFAGTVLIGILAAPRDAADWWLHKMISTGNSFGPVYAGNLTLRSLLAKQGLTGMALNAPWIVGSLVLAVLAVLAIRYALWVDNAPLAVMFTAMLGLLVSPISWSHHWVWAAPTLALLFAMSLRHRWYGVLLMVLFCALTVLTGPQWLLPNTENRELSWTFAQQVVGNAYTLLGMGFLLGGAIAYIRFRPLFSPGTAKRTELTAA
jgi:alpha-1,2-mannosyltransferase